MRITLDTAIAHNLQRQDAVLVRTQDQRQQRWLIYTGLHGHGVVAGAQDQVGQQCVADGFACDAEVHGYVAEIQRQDGWVGDVHCAEHVGAVGEDFFGAGEDLNVCDVEAGKVVEAWDG